MALNYNFISQEFQNISIDKISEICKQVEKVISSVNVTLTTKLPSEVKDMLNIILLLTSEKYNINYYINLNVLSFQIRLSINEYHLVKSKPQTRVLTKYSTYDLPIKP